MPAASRVGDKAQCVGDAHGCPGCPHPTQGPAIVGSPNVVTNNKPAFRQNDIGIHAACCGTNMWQAVQGSSTVFINKQPAVRFGDKTKHCGGNGQMIEGSPNVNIGAETTGGAPRIGPSSAKPVDASSISASSSATAGPSDSSGSASKSAAAGPAATEPPLEPKPLLISAAWSSDRAPLSSAIKLSAVAVDMSGKPATFSILDADDASKSVASLTATCGSDEVSVNWRTPDSAPPARFVFEVSADGKLARSGVLTLFREFEATLMLGDDPADGVAVRLRVDGGDDRTATSDDKGVVRFPDAPFGDVMLYLEDG